MRLYTVRYLQKEKESLHSCTKVEPHNDSTIAHCPLYIKEKESVLVLYPLFRSGQKGKQFRVVGVFRDVEAYHKSIPGNTDKAIHGRLANWR